MPSPTSSSDGGGVDVEADALVTGPSPAGAPCWRPSVRGRSSRAACGPAWHVACGDGRAPARDGTSPAPPPRTAASLAMLDEPRRRRSARRRGAEPAAGLDGRPRADPPRPQRRQHHAGAGGRRAGRGRRPLRGWRTRPRRRDRARARAGRPPSRSTTSAARSSGSSGSGRRRSRWDGRSRETSGHEIPVADLPFMRWREVEVHRADLGVGYEPADWPSGVRPRGAGAAWRCAGTPAGRWA